MPEMTYSAALNKALREEMNRDPSVFIMGEDIGVWGDGGGVFSVTKGLLDEFGSQRVLDTPISEEGFVSMGVGAALVGSRPVVEVMYSDFLTLVMDPLVNQAAKMRYMFGGQAKVPLVVRTNLGAAGGKAAQHSQSFETWFMHVPGIKVVVPTTPADAAGLLKTAIRDDNPVLFLEHKLLYFMKGEVPDVIEPIPFGQAMIRREGKDVTLVATQVMLQLALKAADQLQEEGIDVEVIDPRTLVPLDLETILTSVKKTGRCVIAHEAVERAGWAAEIGFEVSLQAFDFLDAPIVRVCSANLPVPYTKGLEAVVIPDLNDIKDGIRAVYQGKQYSRGGRAVNE
jgi:acetoin:2,6-dichlorophenolindophenol oxidoreductase subunit beta